MDAKQHQRMMDMARVYCRDACYPIAETDWLKVASVLMERVRELDTALQSLTPGGSGYVGNPDRCVIFALEARNKYREMWREAVQMRNAVIDAAKQPST